MNLYFCRMKLISRFIFWITGWKLVTDYPLMKKMVMVAAPHTSNWDFLYARAAFYLMDVPLKFTIKKELFFFPLGPILKAFGGIPIDRSTKSGMVSKMVELFDKYDEICILVTPEGTRSRAVEWKRGFYHIAEGANVPIILGYLDYKTKTAGIGPTIHPSGNIDKDMEEIIAFYRTKTAKYPEDGVF